MAVDRSRRDRSAASGRRSADRSVEQCFTAPFTIRDCPTTAFRRSKENRRGKHSIDRIVRGLSWSSQQPIHDRSVDVRQVRGGQTGGRDDESRSTRERTLRWVA